MTWFLGFLKSGFAFLGELFKAINQKQLLDAGGAIERDKQNDALQEKRRQTDIIRDNVVDLKYLLPPNKRNK